MRKVFAVGEVVCTVVIAAALALWVISTLIGWQFGVMLAGSILVWAMLVVILGIVAWWFYKVWSSGKK